MADFSHVPVALDVRLHLENIPVETLYKADHCLESKLKCVGFVFHNPQTGETTLVFDKSARILNSSEAKRLMTPVEK